MVTQHHLQDLEPSVHAMISVKHKVAIEPTIAVSGELKALTNENIFTHKVFYQFVLYKLQWQVINH